MQVSFEHKLAAPALISQKKLLNILGKISGRKDFIIDPRLIKPLELIIGMRKLKSAGIDQIYKLQKDEIPATNTQRVFFVQADLMTVKGVSDKISAETSRKNDGNSYHIILVGRKLQSIVKMLEMEGTWSLVSLHVFQWELIKVDEKFLSLENPSVFRELFVHGDQSCLPTLAKSLWTLTQVLGRPSVTILQGKYSHIVDSMLSRLNEELGSPKEENSQLGYMLLVDRDADYASALLTGCTYSSLLDEVFGINSGTVKIKDSKNVLSEFILNSADEVYSQIKGRHFSDVFPYLSAKTKELAQAKEISQKLKIAEMKQFISEELSAATNFKKKLACHITACEAIISQLGHRFEALQSTEHNMVRCSSRRETLTYIDDCLAMNTWDKCSILRLLCLMSIAQDGFYPDELQRIKMQYFHMFGYQYLTVFHALEGAGLCVEQPALISTEVTGGSLAQKVVQAVPLPSRKSTFTVFAQKLKLFPNTSDDSDFCNTTDFSHVFGRAYVPAFCQIVSMLIKNEIIDNDLTKLLPNCSVKKSGSTSKTISNVLVYIVGGVTYAELSAFQLLEKLTGVHIVVASSSTIKGSSLIKSFFDR